LQPNAVQPHTGDAFALPANFTLEPRGSGQPLPDPVQKKMEAFFNTSFADVRVHVGPEPSSIGALAFTHGTDLYFAPGQYNPQSSQGQQLLGHELTHARWRMIRCSASQDQFCLENYRPSGKGFLTPFPFLAPFCCLKSPCSLKRGRQASTTAIQRLPPFPAVIHNEKASSN